MTFHRKLQITFQVRAHARLGLLVRQARLQHDWTQRDLAYQTGVSVSTLRRVERGDPSVALPLVMCGALRLGLLHEFNRLLDSRMPALSHASGLAKSADVSFRCALPSDVQVLLPRALSGPRLADKLTISLGMVALPFGELRPRTSSSCVSAAFTYDPLWLDHKRFFTASPELRVRRSSQRLQACKGSREGGAGRCETFGALEDTLPRGFGAEVMERASECGLLDELRPPGQMKGALDGLCVVPDIVRQGALRVSPYGQPLSDSSADRLLLPRLFDFSAMAAAIRDFEQGRQDLRQLLLLLYGATALGGGRPKCTAIDAQNQLVTAKFPSASDTWVVNRGEVLAMYLAKNAGIDVVGAKLLHPAQEPILLTARFDRAENGGRRPFLSAHSLLHAQTTNHVDHMDLLRCMRKHCLNLEIDGPQFWRRLVFKRLIQDTSDDLRKTGFVYAGNDRWRLAPACGLRPHPSSVGGEGADVTYDPAQRVKLQTLVEQADAFGVNPEQVRRYLRAQLNAIVTWQKRASEFCVNMSSHDIQQIEPAMNNPQTQWARQFLVT